MEVKMIIVFHRWEGMGGYARHHAVNDNAARRFHKPTRRGQRLFSDKGPVIGMLLRRHVVESLSFEHTHSVYAFKVIM